MHFVDADSIYINHWNKAQRWYKKRGGEISYHDIHQSEINMDKNILI